MAGFRVKDFASNKNTERTREEKEEADWRAPSGLEYWEYGSKDDFKGKFEIPGMAQNLEVSVGHQRIKGKFSIVLETLF